ncbi:nickel pincer cofactor biosynthesis protein LarC [Candidatus Laterigemmans baculatus]|uniref:nickel pincer cofactor biosynthesis protein LarC n=1 Tax=Candidatus Laterigemmans baculatus TaxID=2770505 RepID=UPI0013D96811|nr:nickel pincer cofactor biosynthesis protein LarC [Candidatus Laterigemmans baculatus]
MRIAYFDCLSGISGDMTLGALIDAGASRDAILRGVQSLGLGQLDLVVSEVKKCGFRATHVRVEHPPEHAHRHLHHIDAMIDGSEVISDDAKALAKRIFLRLGEAEAKVHGTTIQKVHFHEVGAVDSIADIVGTAIGLRLLEIDAVEASPVPTGTGFIEIAHGRVSVPAPATAELLTDVPIAPSEVSFELTTPTGAAILKATARRFGPLPAFRVQRIGYGAGTRDLEGQANVLRLLIGESEEAAAGSTIESDQVMVLETNIDDTTPEDLAACVARLHAGGAIDVYQTPCLMKKGRSGVAVTVLAPTSRVAALESLLFTHAGTIGVRRYRADRHKLVRREHTVETEVGPVRGKCVWLPAGRWRFSVEFDDADAIAADRGIPLSEVRRLAAEAFQAGQRPEPLHPETSP